MLSSRWATSVVSPVSNSATNFTRHTSSPSSREPKVYRRRNKPHQFAWSLPYSVLNHAKIGALAQALEAVIVWR